MPCKKCENGKYRFGEGNCKYDTLQECEDAHETYDIVELVVDEDNEELSIDAISLVTSPAIETDFVYFNDNKANLTFAKVNEEKRLLVSPALIPYKQIYRYDANKDKNYYVYFTAETVRKAAEAYMKHQNTNSATLQHEEKVTGVHTVESWIVENSTNDKSNLYGYELPVGTWFVTMRVLNDMVWERIKSGELKGLSIEGYFVDKMETLASTKSKLEQVGEIDGFPVFDNIEDAVEYAKTLGCNGYHEHELNGEVVYMPCSNHDILDTLLEIIEDVQANEVCTKLASYTDYPKGATANAERAIIENEERGNKCATQTGKVRAQQLAARKPISFKTVKRVYSYLSRAKTYNTGDYNDCGTISYNLWGGDVMLRWAEKVINRENKTN